MNDKGTRVPFLASFLVNLLKPENRSQFKIKIYHISIRMNDFLINTSIPVTLKSIMFTFRDSKNTFKLDEDLLKTMTNYNFNGDDSNPQDQKKL